jgi:DNA gyrase subunit B
MSESANSYNASDITVLYGHEAIRKRPGMYVGSTTERGLHQAVFEVVGRAVTEVQAGRATSVDVTLTPGGVSVVDDGPDFPVAAAGDTDASSLELLLTRLPAGWEPVGRNTAVMGLAVLGLCVTNALSSRLTAEVRHEGTRWVQQYVRGVPVAPPTAVGPAADRGTTITFWPDPGIFETVECSFSVLADRFRDLAFLNRCLTISLTDARHPGEPRSVRFRSPGGARDFVAFLDTPTGSPVHPDVIGFEWDDPRMEGTAEVALRWCTSREERVHGFANSRPTREGGMHVLGFRDGATNAVNAYVRKRRLRPAAHPDLRPEQICEGLTAIVSLKLDHPCFEGATRSMLGNPTARPCVAEAVQEHLGSWLDSHPEQAAAVIDRIVQGTPGS